MIDRSGIVETAVSLGLDTFSMDAVAGRLGVTTPALYSHVSGREHILRLAAAEVIGQIEPDLEQVDDWREWTRRWATGLRSGLGAVGEELLEAIRSRVDPSALQIAERGVHLLTRAGLDPADAGHALWLVARIAFTSRPPEGSGIHATVETARATIGDDVSSSMTLAMDAVAATGGDEAFQFDLEVVIDGLATRLQTEQPRR